MKRTLIPILVLLLSMPMLLSAKVPVEEDIKARISDPASPSYYPNLLLRHDPLCSSALRSTGMVYDQQMACTGRHVFQRRLCPAGLLLLIRRCQLRIPAAAPFSVCLSAALLCQSVQLCDPRQRDVLHRDQHAAFLLHLVAGCDKTLIESLFQSSCNTENLTC